MAMIAVIADKQRNCVQKYYPAYRSDREPTANQKSALADAVEAAFPVFVAGERQARLDAEGGRLQNEIDGTQGEIVDKKLSLAELEEKLEGLQRGLATVNFRL